MICVLSYDWPWSSIFVIYTCFVLFNISHGLNYGLWDACPCGSIVCLDVYSALPFNHLQINYVLRSADDATDRLWLSTVSHCEHLYYKSLIDTSVLGNACSCGSMVCLDVYSTLFYVTLQSSADQLCFQVCRWCYRMGVIK